ncbi:MAG: hypothetical protein SGI88_05605 [Candidatus Hydrogenedentes bacterium]|nr:hypothetical protein [Candidatus Hydrogenedentota bacterium]
MRKYCLFALCFVLADNGFASYMASASINPTTFTSPTGAYSLYVDPTDRSGSGSANYRYTQNGEELWSKLLPFTLLEAHPLEDGTIVGYAHFHNVEKAKRDRENSGNEILIVLLGRDGEIVSSESIPCPRLTLNGTPYPSVRGIIVNASNNRFIARMDDIKSYNTEQWLIFDLKTGQRISEITLGTSEMTQNTFQFVIAAKAVPGLPLILTHWIRGGVSEAAVFRLVDEVGHTVWSLEAKVDDDHDDSINAMRGEGVILTSKEQGSFSINLVKEQAQASYAVNKADDGSWTVREESRQKFIPPPSREKTAPLLAFPQLDWPKFQEVTLAASARKSKGSALLRSINDFEFDATGRICALRSCCNTIPALLLVEQDGEVLAEINITEDAPSEDQYIVGPAYLGGMEFIVAISDTNEGGRSKFICVDFESGNVSTLDYAQCPQVTALCGFDDGSFAALTDNIENNTSATGLFFFDSAGNLTSKRIETGSSGAPEELFSPEDIATFDGNTIALLENIGGKVKLFDTNDRLVRMIDLEETWGREPSYPTDIDVDPAQGFVIYDFDAENTLVRMDTNGFITGQSALRFEDDRPFAAIGGVKVSPQGELWTSDGTSLLRLNEDGIVDRIVGQKPMVGSLDAPETAYVAHDGRVIISDRRTLAVHVFDAAGNPLGVCLPLPEDLDDLSSVENIAVSGNGNIYCSFSLDLESSGNDGIKGPVYTQFAADFSRKRQLQVNVDNVAQEWHFQPNSDRCWIAGYDDVFLVTGDQKDYLKISRRSDGGWLEGLGAMAVAPDGSLAVLSGNDYNGFFLSTYSAAGEAQTTCSIPSDWRYANIAFDGSRIFVFDFHSRDIRIISRDGTPIGQFQLPINDPDFASGPFIARGEELSFVSLEDLTLYKCRLPK